MRAKVTLFDDKGKELSTVELDVRTDGGAWWSHHYTGDRKLDLVEHEGRRLIGVRLTPFWDVFDARDPESIEQENSNGGNGKLRAEVAGIDHAATTSETVRIAKAAAARAEADRAADKDHTERHAARHAGRPGLSDGMLVPPLERATPPKSAKRVKQRRH